MPKSSRKETSEARRAARVLRPLERKVLILSARFDLDIAEIASRLDLTPLAVERLLAKALCALERELRRRSRPSRLRTRMMFPFGKPPRRR